MRVKAEVRRCRIAAPLIGLAALMASSGCVDRSRPDVHARVGGSATEAGALADADGYLEGIERLAPRIWLIRQGRSYHMGPVGNVTVIEQSDGLVLVDSGSSPGSGRRIVRLVRSVRNKPVKAVIITHWHGDHPFGLSAIREVWPTIRIIATERTRDAMTGPSLANYPQGRPDPQFDKKHFERFGGMAQYLERSAEDPKLAPEDREGFARTLRELEIHRRDIANLFVVAPTEVFRDRLTLSDRHSPVEIFHAGRANTDGDALVWLPRQRVMVTGDVVVSPVPFGYGSYPRDWIEVLRRVRSYNFRVLVPGHGAPQRDRIYLDRLIRLIEEVRAQVAPLAAQGLGLEEVRARINLKEQTRIFTGGDAWLARAFRDNWIAPIVESAWKEAKGIPITQGVG